VTEVCKTVQLMLAFLTEDVLTSKTGVSNSKCSEGQMKVYQVLRTAL